MFKKWLKKIKVTTKKEISKSTDNFYKNGSDIKHMVSNSLKDKIVLVAGGGKGIGKAIAKCFASEGAKVMINARTQKDLEATSASKFNLEATYRICGSTKSEANRCWQIDS